MTTRKFIQNALDFDPVAEAEKLGEGTSIGVAMAFSQDRAALLKRLMDQTGDVHWGQSFADYCVRVESWGFELAYNELRTVTKDDGDVVESYRFYWHPEGWFLTVESYTYGPQDPTPGVNMAYLYYNLQVPSERKSEFWHTVSSGFWIRDTLDTPSPVWVGDHDARQAVKHTIESLKAAGAVPLAKWTEKPYYWLVNYTDTRETEPRREHRVVVAEWEALTKNREAQFPEALRLMLSEAKDR